MTYHDKNRGSSESRKDKLESRDDLSHAFNELLKRKVNGLQWHQRVLERYKNSAATFHFHLFGRRAPQEKVSSGSAPCGISGMPKTVNELAVIKEHCDVHRPQISGGEQQKPVLVFVHECSEGIERSVHSQLRLRALDEGKCYGINGATPSLLTPRKSIWAQEVHIVPDNSRRDAVVRRDLPCDVVQCCVEVSQAVSDDQSHMGIGLLRDSRSDSNAARDYREIDVWTIKFGILVVDPEFILERFQVLLCPDDFEFCSS
jgi:hypothetical protein